MVFHRIFNGPGKIKKDIKKIFDATSKCERLTHMLFNVESLAEAGIITSFENWWNLLLKECESAEILEECYSCLSTNEIIAQIESDSFYCSLPKVLSRKRDSEKRAGKGSF